jgi:hypothetical protein
MSRAALRRVKNFMADYLTPDSSARWEMGDGALTAADLRAVVALAERAAELERLVRDARGLLDRDYLDALRAALSPKRQSRRRRAKA